MKINLNWTLYRMKWKVENEWHRGIESIATDKDISTARILFIGIVSITCWVFIQSFIHMMICCCTTHMEHSKHSSANSLFWMPYKQMRNVVAEKNQGQNAHQNEQLFVRVTKEIAMNFYMRVCLCVIFVPRYCENFIEKMSPFALNLGNQ